MSDLNYQYGHGYKGSGRGILLPNHTGEGGGGDPHYRGRGGYEDPRAPNETLCGHDAEDPGAPDETLSWGKLSGGPKGPR